MPNGGPDCCGTCWYDNANIVSGRHSTGPDEGFHFCTIRQFAPTDPYWTYCYNHRDWQPEGDPVPLGPAYGIKNEAAHGYEREPITPFPDSEAIRAHLLAILESSGEGGLVTPLLEVALDHIEALGERRSIPALRRIVGGDGPEDVRSRASEVLRTLER